MKLPKLFALIIFISVLISFMPDSLKAQVRSNNGGNFGIGMMLGEPTGVSIKSWHGDRVAFDIGAAWSLSGRNEALHLHSDFLLHSWF